MKPEAIEARKKYMREYQKSHREEINAKQKEWYKNNPDKAKAKMERYWDRKAMKLAENTK